MEIIKETPVELTLRKTPNFLWSIFTLIPLAMFIGLPLFISYQILSHLGDTVTICKRLKAEVVNCQIQRNSLLKLAPTTTSKYNSVTAVKYKSIEEKDSEGRVLVNDHIFLTTSSGEISAYEEINGEPEKLQNIVSKLSLFLKSQKSSITFKENPELGRVLASIGFLMIFEMMGLIVLDISFRVSNLKIDKNQNEISGHSLSVLGFWKYSFNLQEIDKIEVKIETDSDSDFAYFTPQIVMRSGKKIYLGQELYQDRAVLKANKVRNFLGVTEQIVPLTSEEIEHLLGVRQRFM
jgi:hypothetical protein